MGKEGTGTPNVPMPVSVRARRDAHREQLNADGFQTTRADRRLLSVSGRWCVSGCPRLRARSIELQGSI
jgi:hypothetical protein